MINKTISIPSSKFNLFMDFIKQHGLKEAETQIDDLTVEQITGINKARKSLKAKGGITHDDAMERLKDKFPQAFRK